MPNSFEFGYRSAVRMLDEYPDIDAIMAAVDIQGMGALRALRERGIRCPDDVRVMSLTGHAIGNMLETTMTAMEVPALDMGRKAARMAIETVEAKASPGDKASVQHLCSSPTLVVRESA